MTLFIECYYGKFYGNYLSLNTLSTSVHSYVDWISLVFPTELLQGFKFHFYLLKYLLSTTFIPLASLGLSFCHVVQKATQGVEPEVYIICEARENLCKKNNMDVLEKA